MSKTINYCAVENVTDTNPEPKSCDINEFVKQFRKPEPRGSYGLKKYLQYKDGTPEQRKLADKQKYGPGFIPVTFAEPGTKVKVFITSCSFASLDFDDSHYSFAELENILTKNKIKSILHTTYSHSKKAGKFRVIIFLDKPIKLSSAVAIEKRYQRIFDYFVSIFGDHIDRSCRNIGQLYFTPSCPPDAVDIYRFKYIKGQPLCTDDFKVPKIDEEKLVPSPNTVGKRPGDDFNARGNWEPILTKMGWQFFFADESGRSYWTRPGKTSSISGVVFPDTNVFYVYSSAPEVSPFESRKAYSLFNAYTMIEHDGDPIAAATQLRADGYGVNGLISSMNEEDPIKIGLKLFPETEFPLDLFPKSFRKLVMAYAAAYQCQPAFMAMTFLTILSAAVGNSIILAVKNSWQIPPFLWFIVIGSSGDGKTPSEMAALQHVYDLQGIDVTRYAKEFAKYKQNLAAFNKDPNSGTEPKEPSPIKDYITTNFTMESLIPKFASNSRGLILHFDEIAALFLGLNQYRGGKGNDTELLLQLYNAKGMKIDRVNKSIFCRESGVAILGGIQPERISNIFSVDMQDNGMIFRFIPMFMEVIDQDISDDDISQEHVDEWGKLVDWMYGIDANIDESTGRLIKNQLQMTKEGKAEWVEFANSLKATRKHVPKMLGAYISKLVDYSGKLVSMHHMLCCYEKDDFSHKCKSASVEAAIKLTEYFAGQAMKMVSLMSKNTGKTATSSSKNAVRDNKIEQIREAAVQALVSLRDEVKRGKLPLSLVREKANELLPASSQLDRYDKCLPECIRELGLVVESGSGHKTFIKYDEVLISELVTEIS